MEPITFALTIGAVRYDTATATLLAHDTRWGGGLAPLKRGGQSEFLFRTPLRGLYFLFIAHFDEPRDSEIVPLTRNEALTLWERLPVQNVRMEQAFPGAVGGASAIRPLQPNRTSGGPLSFELGEPEHAHRSPLTVTDFANHGAPTAMPPPAPVRMESEASAEMVEALPDPDPDRERAEDGQQSGDRVHRDEAQRCSTVLLDVIADTADMRQRRPGDEDGAAPAACAGGPEHTSPAAKPGSLPSKPEEAGPVQSVIDGLVGGHASTRLDLEDHDPPAQSSDGDSSVHSPAAGTVRAVVSDSQQGTPRSEPVAEGANEAADLWLDEQDEWQVRGVVRHAGGRAGVEGESLTISQAESKGFLRRRSSQSFKSVRLDLITSVTLTRDAEMRVRMEFVYKDDKPTAMIALHHCRPVENVREILACIRAANADVHVRGEWWSVSQPEE